MMEVDKGGGTKEPSNKRAYLESVIPTNGSTSRFKSGCCAAMAIRPATRSSEGLAASPESRREAVRRAAAQGVQTIVVDRNRRNRKFFSLWNRNKNCKLSKSGTRTGTVIGDDSGTLIKWYHKSSKVLRNTQYKIVYFLH
jgi:hypothetical protein